MSNLGAKRFMPKSTNYCHFWAVLGFAFKDEEITLLHEFIFVIFHWCDIIKKNIVQSLGFGKKNKGGDSHIGEFVHKREWRGG